VFGGHSRGNRQENPFRRVAATLLPSAYFNLLVPRIQISRDELPAHLHIVPNPIYPNTYIFFLLPIEMVNRLEIGKFRQTLLGRREKRQQVRGDNEDIKGKSDAPGVVVPLIVAEFVRMKTIGLRAKTQ
jgi:hypothetical protein